MASLIIGFAVVGMSLLVTGVYFVTSSEPEFMWEIINAEQRPISVYLNGSFFSVERSNSSRSYFEGHISEDSEASSNFLIKGYEFIVDGGVGREFGWLETDPNISGVYRNVYGGRGELIYCEEFTRGTLERLDWKVTVSRNVESAGYLDDPDKTCP